jgi:hypothetical protein
LPPVRVKETFVEDGEWISLTLVPIPTPKPYVYKPAEWRAKREAKKKKVPEVEASVADLEKIQVSVDGSSLSLQRCWLLALRCTVGSIDLSR